MRMLGGNLGMSTSAGAIANRIIENIVVLGTVTRILFLVMPYYVSSSELNVSCISQGYAM